MFYLYAFLGMFLQLFVLILILNGLTKEEKQAQEICSHH
jgi:hypothetical protein